MKTKVVEITVTARHIRLGQPTTISSCPVALALRAKLRRPVGVVETQVTLWGRWPSQGSIDVALPKSVQNFIKRFDADKPVKPFTFRLRLPQ